mgnify:FL=1|jgi:hypothetical protein
MKGEKYMTQVNSYLAEFSRKSNLSPVYKHKVIKSLRQEIEAKIEGGDTEKDVISSFGPVSLLAQNMDNELYSQTCIMPKMSRLIFVALLFVYVILFVFFKWFWFSLDICGEMFLSGAIGAIAGAVLSIIPRKGKKTIYIIPMAVAVLGIIQHAIYFQKITRKGLISISSINKFLNYITSALKTGAWICFVVVIIALFCAVKNDQD